MTEAIKTNTISTISTSAVRFEELKYVAKLDCPTGMRISKIIRKGEGNISTAAFVPCLTEGDIMTVLDNPAGTRYLRECLEAVQDKIVRAVLDSSKTDTLDLSVINVNQILAFVSAESESKGRLSKDAIEKWFMSDLAPHIQKALVTKGLAFGQVEQTVQAFKGYFASLAGRSVSMNDKIKSQLEKAISLLPDSYESELGERIIAKLLDASEAVEVLDAL